MRRTLALLAVLNLAAPTAALAVPPPPPKEAGTAQLKAGFVAMTLHVEPRTEAVMARLRALGWHTFNELRVMTARPDGKRACIIVEEGTLPIANVAAARKLPGVKLSPYTKPL